MLMIYAIELTLALLFASVCITRRDPVVQSAGILIGILSMLVILAMFVEVM